MDLSDEPPVTFARMTVVAVVKTFIDANHVAIIAKSAVVSAGREPSDEWQLEETCPVFVARFVVTEDLRNRLFVAQFLYRNH